MVIMHAHYTIDTVKIISVDHMSTLNVAHQQLTQPEGKALGGLSGSMAEETRN